MLKVYVIATSDQDARERFVASVLYAAGGPFENVAVLFVDESRAQETLAALKAEVGQAAGLNFTPSYCDFVRAAKVFVVEVLDVLVGEV